MANFNLGFSFTSSDTESSTDILLSSIPEPILESPTSINLPDPPVSDTLKILPPTVNPLLNPKRIKKKNY